MKNKLNIKTMYLFEFISVVFTTITAITGLILFVIFRFEILNVGYLGIPILIISTIAFMITIILSIKEMVPILRDYRDFKNENYKEICGEVIGFKSNKDAESGVQINSFPIVRSESQNIVILKVDTTNLKVGGKYHFCYLEHSKIAEVKEYRGIASDK